MADIHKCNVGYHLIKTWDVPICWTFWQGFEWAPIKIILSPSNIVAYISIVCLLIGSYYFWIYNKKLEGSPTSLPIMIKKITDRSQDYINSLATLVTLFAVVIVNYETWRDLLILMIMLAVILLVIHEQIYIMQILLWLC